MTPRQRSVLLITIGAVLALSAVALPNQLPVQPHTWLGFASVYLVTGLLIEALRTVRTPNSADFRTTIAVALVAVAFPVVLQVWPLHTNPLRSLSDLPTVARSFQLLVPYAMALSTPLGAATTGRRRAGVAGAILVPFVLATLVGIAEGGDFGPIFAVGYHLFFLVVALVAGLPLFLYGRTLRDSDSLPRPSRSEPMHTATEES
ncbi:hypothetical protein SAMN04487949_0533 [Halogranum gelatinilyticum]|uniref:Uncharacterized protein n=1 Tax=Halogranum gelatinilyticum TaxID=660521 RepID=A0A1G9PTX3_9EURY|nr:hypothetical protein [Halogranum gelatinilyticum]SDM02204.1 hypothetical protein SAMN04487949_0533 [Halogranum gelatinilyticum]